MSIHDRYFAAAKRVIPGGVNSPVRSFSGVGGTPIFIKRAKGAYLYAEDGRRYIDYVSSWGPMITGHADDDIVAAVQAAATNGLSFGAPTRAETAMAECLCALVPALARVRMVNSGTEAVMSALRLARGVTGRDVIVKFTGCYHGHSDSLLIAAGSGALTCGVPTSPGVPAALAAHTAVLPFNDIAAIRAYFADNGAAIAAVIVEPVCGNMNCVLPVSDFLQTVRALCDSHGSLLIFDEVMTGFRVARGGAGAYFDVLPDIVTLGKIIGGGLPVGAFGGSAEIMAHLAPDGAVYQAGTLSGNPLAMAAGLTVLQKIQEDGFYERLSTQTARLASGIRNTLRACGIACTTTAIGGMFGIFFTDRETITSFADVQACDTKRYARFFHAMCAQGVYFAPSAFEAGFVSSAHDDDVIDATLHAVHSIAKTL